MFVPFDVTNEWTLETWKLYEIQWCICQVSTDKHSNLLCTCICHTKWRTEKLTVPYFTTEKFSLRIKQASRGSSTGPLKNLILMSEYFLYLRFKKHHHTQQAKVLLFKLILITQLYKIDKIDIKVVIRTL